MKVILAVLFFVLIVPNELLAQKEILRNPNERFAYLVEYDFQPNYIEVEEGYECTMWMKERKIDRSFCCYTANQPGPIYTGK